MVHSDTYCHPLDIESFLNWIDLTIVDSFAKLLSNSIIVTVHVAPNVAREVFIRTFVILVSLNPLESVAVRV
jgi:hypothetical protein